MLISTYQSLVAFPAVKMSLFKADDIYDVAYPLHACSQLIGLTAFWITRKSGVFVPSINLYNVFCIVVATLAGFMITYMLIFEIDELIVINSVTVSVVYEKSMFCVILGFIATTLLANWWTFASKLPFARVLNLLYEVDEELARMKFPVNLKRHKKVILFFVTLTKSLAVLSLSMTSLIGETTNLFHVNFMFMISMYFVVQTNVFFVFQFTFLMWAIKLRYQKINLFLAENFLASEDGLIKDGNGKLNKAALLHDKLVDASECINRCYGVPVRLFSSAFV